MSSVSDIFDFFGGFIGTFKDFLGFISNLTNWNIFKIVPYPIVGIMLFILGVQIVRACTDVIT